MEGHRGRQVPAGADGEPRPQATQTGKVLRAEGPGLLSGVGAAAARVRIEAPFLLPSESDFGRV